MDIKQMIIPMISTSLREPISNIKDSIFNQIEEIRIRVNEPIMIYYLNKDWFLKCSGELMQDINKSITALPEDITSTLELLSGYSLYAFDEELKNGYITIEGGHRVGVVGKVVLEKGKVKTIRYISGINIRIAHEVIGCADKVMPYITRQNNIYHTLIVSPPKCGKTTLLRDMIRQISNGNEYIKNGITIGVVDERSEIAGCYKGIAQNNIGIRTDILDCCPKVEGMMMLLRSMSPQVIAVDEIGSTGDLDAIENILNAGIKLICTVHGNSLKDLKQKPVLNKILDKKIFERIIFLSSRDKVGTVSSILDAGGNEIMKSYMRYTC